MDRSPGESMPHSPTTTPHDGTPPPSQSPSASGPALALPLPPPLPRHQAVWSEYQFFYLFSRLDGRSIAFCLLLPGGRVGVSTFLSFFQAEQSKYRLLPPSTRREGQSINFSYFYKGGRVRVSTFLCC